MIWFSEVTRQFNAKKFTSCPHDWAEFVCAEAVKPKRKECRVFDLIPLGPVFKDISETNSPPEDTHSSPINDQNLTFFSNEIPSPFSFLPFVIWGIGLILFGKASFSPRLNSLLVTFYLVIYFLHLLCSTFHVLTLFLSSFKTPIKTENFLTFKKREKEHVQVLKIKPFMGDRASHNIQTWYFNLTWERKMGIKYRSNGQSQFSFCFESTFPPHLYNTILFQLRSS